MSLSPSSSTISLAAKRQIVLLIAAITVNAVAIHAESASKVRERRVDVGDGVALRVIEAGQKDSSLVFVPGWSTGADIWRQQIAKPKITLSPISPDNVGNTCVREVRVVGNDLIIQLDTTAIDGTPTIRTNTFSRIG
jgi:hypothetical protein